MMNSQEFTKFLNELRAEYDLPAKFDQGSLMSQSEETDTYEDVPTEEDCARLQQRDETLS